MGGLTATGVSGEERATGVGDYINDSQVQTLFRRRIIVKIVVIETEEQRGKMFHRAPNSPKKLLKSLLLSEFFFAFEPHTSHRSSILVVILETKPIVALQDKIVPHEF
ncbi:hypothetical protein KSP40_PGU006446 [Platanthera guangdongensis]|uniref:Uncharacterized protein n=1 Tax=Platanthera guangdongensis TaxID=2320717 RepID=A0ABR2LRZ4_9ASPA